jgi:hypothetical protein
VSDSTLLTQFLIDSPTMPLARVTVLMRPRVEGNHATLLERYYEQGKVRHQSQSIGNDGMVLLVLARAVATLLL